MNDFVASNGLSVRLHSDSTVEFESDLARREYSLAPSEVKALREFFLAERDAELGRWRSKEHPDYAVYDHGDGRVRVMRDADGNSYSFDRESIHRFYLPNDAEIAFQRIAREFFAAHPELNPWHNAQHGEVWALTIHLMGERPYQVVRTEESGFRFFLIADQEGFRPGLFPNEEQIIAGRRIWPEVI